MFRKKCFTLIALLTVMSLLFTGCAFGKSDKEADDTPASQSSAEILNLAEWNLSASTWSSPNGATVHLVATPAGYAKGQTASFVVRLEGEDVESVPCEWDGQHYTASADLNGDDGYCYYVLLTGSTGETAEVPVNIASSPVDESLINLASSLESTCSLVVESFTYDGSWLSVTGGSVNVQPPKLKNDGEAVTCVQALLSLTLDGQNAAEVELAIPEPDDDGNYTIALTDTSFQAPAMEDDQQLSILLAVTLSNGQVLTANGGTWFYNDGSLMMSVG